MKQIFFVFMFLFNFLYISANEKIIPFQIERKIGFLNERLEIIFSPEYDDYIYCHETWVYAIKQNEKSTLQYILNCNGKKIRVPDGYVGFVIGKKYYGFTDYSKSIVYSLDTDEKITFPNFRLYSSSSEDFIMIDNISSRPRCNYINLKGELFFSDNKNLKLEWFDKKINRGVVRENGWAILIDSNLKAAGSKKYGFINNFSCGLALSDEGFVNYDGELKIPIKRIPEIPIYFEYNVIPVVITEQNDFELYSKEECKDANWAILNSSGKIVKSNIEADAISCFSKDGVAILYNFVNEKAKYNVINAEGEIINEKSFDKIFPSENGFSRAIKNERDFLINVKNGKIYDCNEF